MRTLPDNPNLDHLRRQAKELLAGLRDSDPQATLAGAQSSLAGQYGFGTWADLKAEVDRLQGKAEVASPALVRAIAERFALGEVTGEMRSLARPDEIGRRWSLDTTRGRWAVRNVDDLYPAGDGEADTALQLAATAAGVLLPEPVRSRAGAVVEVVDGHRWRVYGWLRSGPPLVAPASATVARAIGGILARIHRLALPAERICPWHTTHFVDMSWSDLAATASGKGASWAPILADLVPALADLDDIGRDAQPSPPVFSHNNLYPANVRRGAGGNLIVTGWEHAAGQPPAWELAELLTHWAVDPGGGINVAGARALADGYRAEAGDLAPLDLAAFRGAATSLGNYVYGQVWVALGAEGEENQRFADRNVRHLLTHVPTRPTYERLLSALRS
jgi:Ser/Thr protein kinase RdoA (MazF antagonist)